jgi:hypothetical protein
MGVAALSVAVSFASLSAAVAVWLLVFVVFALFGRMYEAAGRRRRRPV